MYTCRDKEKHAILVMLGVTCRVGLSPQIRRLYSRNSKAAISLTFDLHCKAIAALIVLDYSALSSYLRTLPRVHILQYMVSAFLTYLFNLFKIYII